MEAATDDVHAIDEGDTDDAPIDESKNPTPSPEEFVNTGLQLWEEIRHRWISSSSSSGQSSSSSSSASSGSSPHPPLLSSPSSKKKTPGRRHHARDVDIDEVIDLIVSNRWRQQPPAPPTSRNSSGSSFSSSDAARGSTRRRDDACFPTPVSLPQMVDVLVDLWEAEGLDI